MPLAEKNGLILDHLTHADASAIPPLFLNSFHVYPFFQHMVPDTEATSRGWTDATINALDDPNTICLKVTDPKTGQIIGHGRWVKPSSVEVAAPKDQPGLEGDRWPQTFMDACDEKLAGPLFDAFDRNRGDLMGTKRHWYMELLLTHSDYQGRGCASMILKHGCDLADGDQLPCYIDSSPMGKAVYEKFGWTFNHREDFEHKLSYYFGTREARKN